MRNADENQAIPPKANQSINQMGSVNPNVSNQPIEQGSINQPFKPNGEQMIQGSTPSGLKKMIEQIYREEKMDQVVIVLEKVKNARQRYQNSYWLYRIFLPGPFLLVWNIKKLLQSNTVTSQLVKTLDPDEVALLLSNVLYAVSVLFGFVILISLSFKVSNLQWWFVTGSVFMLLLAIRVIWYEKIIRDTRCVKLYDDFSNAIVAQEAEERKFIQNICGLYNKLRNTENESKVNRLLDRIKIKDKEEYRRLELESQENLQALEASVAYAQASNEQMRQKLINETELEYMASKYQITGEGKYAQAHQITLAMIRSEETVLKALADALVGDEKANRDMLRHIQQELAILGGLKGDLGKDGRGAYTKANFNEKLHDLMKKRAKRYGSTEP
jgi:hypothetical protein